MKLEFKGTTYNDLDFWAKNDKRKLIEAVRQLVFYKKIVIKYYYKGI